MRLKTFFYFFAKYKRTLIGFAFSLLSMISVSFGCSLSFSIKSDFGSQMANVIRLNNQLNKEGQTYWRCEPIESRKDWLGWGVKSYLTSLANPWAVYGDDENNNCFLYTDSSLGQTFIRNKSTGELISISVFASPSSRSLSCFDIKLRDNGIVDTKYGFYCSEQLAALLNDDLYEQQLIVNCGNENASIISFNGVIKRFGYNFVNQFISDKGLYIVIPYMFDVDGKDEIISYDMLKFTGQSSFYAILKNDRYENNYYTLMIDAIYQMGGVKDQLCYKGTYIDSFYDLFAKYEDIESSVQSDFVNLANFDSKKALNIVFGIILIVVGLVGIGMLIFKMKYSFYIVNAFNIIVSSSMALMIFWIIGEVLYVSKISEMLFWGIGGRIFTFVFVGVLTILAAISTTYINKYRYKEKGHTGYYSVDI